ncbi:MAG: helix-turn-helix transcriptional regulator [Proteobacteria bacterium]|nr:helix-turn-helix transcriptional regulator [Pseudomonadota bacterium]MBS0576557.1 helix-turn-helix transcriptional regulator [Pseudomonadota bacterium]
MPLRHELVVALKRLLKAQGITYAMLAERIGLSEAAVKRMFSRQALSLQRLEEICTVLDIGLGELASETHQRHPVLTELDADSEQALVDDPRLLLATYLTINRWSQDEVLASFRFTVPEYTLLMTRLDRMGVIELLPGNKYRVRTARNFRWRRGGPMERMFRLKLLPDFFSREFVQPNETLLLLSGMCTPASAAILQRKLEELAAQFDALMAHDAALPIEQRFGVSLVLGQRPWKLKLFDPLLREP